MERKTGQLSFLDSLTADIGGRRTAEFFQKCNKLIPWQLLAQPLKDMYRNNTDKRTRKSPFPRAVECQNSSKSHLFQ